MLKDFYTGAKIAVTGAAGTVGTELLHQLLEFPVAEVRALDNNENGLFFCEQHHRADSRLHAFLCDVRELNQLERMLAGMDYVFHVAALKHVPLCERSPIEAVETDRVGEIGSALDAVTRTIGPMTDGTIVCVQDGAAASSGTLFFAA